ncbi:hypothetical protein LCM23_14600 [Cytobacillus kochii]|uniref:hypothetical protein n=1 Tax=Cytobacillus kochii TaxID=859143 RepID=UPI001CD5909C|nr:hypothetical protein [Cytobacillus kochii]MCA1027327.1 hypothetical protein [Cytobacillus kochii]
MAYSFIDCEYCGDMIRPNTLRKLFVGYYNREPVYKHHYPCNSCGGEMVIRYYHSSTNKWYDKVMMCKLSLDFDRGNEDKIKDILLDLEIAEDALNKANKKIINKLGLIGGEKDDDGSEGIQIV